MSSVPAIGFPGSPNVRRAGIVVADPTTLAIQRVIALQYNPDSLSRSLQIRATTTEAGDRLDALRLTGPPVETIKLDAELDAHRSARVSEPESKRGAVRSLSAARRARNVDLSVERADSKRQYARRGRGHRSSSHGSSANAVRLERQSHSAGSPDRVQRDRRGLRYQPQSHSREGQPGNARAQRQRSRLRSEGQQHLSRLPAAQRDAGRQSGTVGLAALGITSIA